MYELNRGKIGEIFTASNQEQVFKYFELLRGNSIEYSKKATDSFRMIIILTFLWFLVKLDIVNLISLNGIQLKSFEWLTILLPIPMIFYYYRYISHNLLFVAARDLTEDFYHGKFPEFHKKDMTQLLHYPSFEVIEYVTNYTHDHIRKKPWWDWFIVFWVWAIDTLLLILPGMAIIGISIFNLIDSRLETNYIVLDVVLGIVAITLMRIIAMYKQMKRLIR